ncbi:MAG: metallophosphoesterase [Acidisphaera sp.]|nr:metallophosphoesterase [Acidisphaera sp.]
MAIIGDWGTGEARAQALLRAVAQHRPDVLIHLGDIYYSCDMREADAFFRNVTAAFPPGSAQVFTLCGNHDMYGGGVPYYALLDRIGQPASFFCLRNASWQILAMDTGYNDFDPFQGGTAATWVQDGTDAHGRPAADQYSELEWHEHKFATAGSRRTVLLSHHPLFTRNSPISGSVCNERLQAQIRQWLPQVALWLWGHEHSQVVYTTFSGVTRGRCLGASAIPVPGTDTPYDVSRNFPRGQDAPGLQNDPLTRLGIDQATGLYDLGYGVLTLAGATGTMRYYGFNETSGARLVWEETL